MLIVLEPASALPASVTFRPVVVLPDAEDEADAADDEVDAVAADEADGADDDVDAVDADELPPAALPLFAAILAAKFL